MTALADANTGLVSNDVFYFGNAIGETGDSAANAYVNATDQLGARNHPHTLLSPAASYDPYDFNHDARVNATDELIARNNQTTFLTGLKLITVPAGFRQLLAPKGGHVLVKSSLAFSSPGSVQAGPGVWAAHPQASAKPQAVGAASGAGFLVPSTFASPEILSPLAFDRAAAPRSKDVLPSAAGPAGKAVSSSPGPSELEGMLVDVLSQARLTVPLKK